jgi:hypothetical protein
MIDVDTIASMTDRHRDIGQIHGGVVYRSILFHSDRCLIGCR